MPLPVKDALLTRRDVKRRAERGTFPPEQPSKEKKQTIPSGQGSRARGGKIFHNFF